MNTKRNESAVVSGAATRGGGFRVVYSGLFRLFVSYVALIFFVGVGTTVGFYLFFQSRYNSEVERVHQVIVKDITARIVTRIVNPAKQVYLKCATKLLGDTGDFFLGDDTANGNALKLYATYRFLTSLRIPNRGELTGITLYYRKAGIVIGSPGGVRYLEENGATMEPAPFKWFLGQTRSSRWLGGGDDSPRVLRVFPILSSPRQGTVVISIDIRRSLIEDIISGSSRNGSSYVVDEGGALVASSHGAAWNSALAGVFSRLKSGTVADTITSRVLTLNGRSSLVTTVPISDTGWTLANVMPLAILYQESAGFRMIFAAISLTAVILSILVAAYLTARVHNPVDRAISRVRGLFGTSFPSPPRPMDDYRLIDYAIENLLTRQDELSGMLQRAGPSIKREIAISMLNGDYSRLFSREFTLKLFGLPSLPERYFTALIAVEEEREGDRIGRTRYQLAEALEETTDGLLVTAVMIDGAIDIVAEAPSEDSKSSAVEVLAMHWIEQLQVRHGIVAVVCVGRVVDTLDKVPLSFDAAKKRAKYRYFFPERSLFSEENDVLLREGRSAELPESCYEAMKRGLRRGNAAECSTALHGVVEFVRSDAAGADQCRRELDRYGRIMGDVQAALLPYAAREFRNDAVAAILGASNIQEYVSAANSGIARFFSERSKMSDNRSLTLLNDVKQLIDRDLGGNLSSSRLGEAVGVSPDHLGRVFKQATGITLVDYVTEVRLVEAARLLSETTSSVQDIGKVVGFDTPSYFIRRFKERYGQTPQNYRRSLLSSKVSRV